MLSFFEEMMTTTKTFTHGMASRTLRLFSSPPRLSSGLTVLLVEDDEADAYLIRRALAKNARVDEIVLAEDGIEALELLDRRRIAPDLAIVDLHMPRRDGLALLRDFEIRSSAGFPSVVLTSSKSNKDALRAAKRGAVKFLTKPKTVEDLASVLDQVIDEVPRRTARRTPTADRRDPRDDDARSSPVTQEAAASGSTRIWGQNGAAGKPD